MADVPPRSFLLGLYLALSRRAGRPASRLLARRARAGREDTARLGEKTGLTGIARPAGRLAWFHAASVGEAVSLLELLRRLTGERPGLTCLVTTVTVSSARYLETRLPERCVHQYAPLDVLPWVERFLDHWRPDLAVWTESELWPGMLHAAHARRIPMLLVNARISARSFRRWQWTGWMAGGLLARFGRILAQDDRAAAELGRLGAQGVVVTGSLKEGAAPLAHDEAERAAIARALGQRPVWLAASTHPGEEEVVAAVHARARQAMPFLALILAPRHPPRGDALALMLRARGWTVAQRSKGEPFGRDTDVYLADTLGEMGLWYRVAPVTFVGGSIEEIGGHNPFEPAMLGCAVLFGPHVRNFAEAYARLKAADAAVEVAGEAELARALVETLAPDRAARMAAAAWEAVSEGAEVTDAVLGVIEGYLDGLPGRAAE